MPIAPRTYRAHVARTPSKHALWDMTGTELLVSCYESGRRPPESQYGSLKIWSHLQFQGVPMARSTVADPHDDRASDLVKRRFTAEPPDELWVADFPCVGPASGRFVYTAFVIDAFAGLIIAWAILRIQAAFRAIRDPSSRRIPPHTTESTARRGNSPLECGQPRTDTVTKSISGTSEAASPALSTVTRDRHASMPADTLFVFGAGYEEIIPRILPVIVSRLPPL